MDITILRTPSVYQYHDNVYFLGFQAQVLDVHFRNLSVSYDLAVYFKKEGADYERRVYNIDELMIERESPYNVQKIVMENCDAFIDFLKSHSIDFKPSGLGTQILSDCDLFWLGAKWQRHKAEHNQA